jgi:hypothetical protein
MKKRYTKTYADVEGGLEREARGKAQIKDPVFILFLCDD